MIKICSVGAFYSKEQFYVISLLNQRSFWLPQFSDLVSNEMCVKHDIYSQKRCSIFADFASQGETGPW